MVAFLKGISTVLLLAAAFWAVGCGSGSQAQGPVEKLGYIAAAGNRGQLMLTSTAGGEGDSLLEWLGDGERFSFSNDGRYFSINIKYQPPGTLVRHRYFIAATDGSHAFHMPGRVDLLTFSPDNTRVAYVTMPLAGPNEVMVMDLATGQTRTLASGNGLLNPIWVDNQTLVYTAVGGSTAVSRAEGGVIHSVDLATGVDRALTPADSKFSTYGAPVSVPRPKVALIERGAQNNLWSLDVARGELKQITNNVQDHYRASYLADGNRILFQEQKSREDTMSSEICVLQDDGSDFSMLTSNFYFDGLQTFSLNSGRIAYQQTRDTGETSIWTMNDDGSAATKLVETKDRWVGDPNFVPVTTWTDKNPLQLAVEPGAGGPVKVTVQNTADHPVDAVLRAFPGSDLLLAPVGGHSADALDRQHGGTAPDPRFANAQAALEWSLKLGPGEQTDIGLTAAVRSGADPADETALLYTLSVPGAPPRMFWDLQGLQAKPKV